MPVQPAMRSGPLKEGQEGSFGQGLEEGPLLNEEGGEGPVRDEVLKEAYEHLSSLPSSLPSPLHAEQEERLNVPPRGGQLPQVGSIGMGQHGAGEGAEAEDDLCLRIGQQHFEGKRT